MKIIYKSVLLFLIIWSGCKTEANKMVIPDLRPNFLQLMNQRDSTLVLDSFYFIRTDTMNKKEALTHQRFPFFNILSKINVQLERMSKDSHLKTPFSNERETMEYLNDEKAYVEKEIDSLNKMIAVADSVTPIGYRAFYKATVRMTDKFVVSDTIAYAISLKMKVSDWDRNLEKVLDSLAVGKRLHAGGNQ
jgi:hypothetical protein